jgi:hypothetical protein
MTDASPNDIQPPDVLKARVTGTLRERGLLRRAASPWRAVLAIAAGLVLFASGVIVGGRPERLARTGGNYALLLYEDAGFDRQTPEDTYIAEYSAWAESLRKRGVLAGGNALDPGSRLLRDSATIETRDVTTNEGTMSGYFIIRAASQEEAEAIAKTCPHLKHGGRIALRRIIAT